MPQIPEYSLVAPALDAIHPDGGEEHRDQPTMAGRKTAPRPQVTPPKKRVVGPAAMSRQTKAAQNPNYPDRGE